MANSRIDDDLNAFAVQILASRQADFNPRVLAEVLLESAIRVGAADMGSVQFVDRDHLLRIEAHRGLHPPFLDFFARVQHGQAACGTALQRGKIVEVEDVATSSGIFDEASRLMVLDAGARSVQSIPLRTGRGQVIGMLSLLHRDSGLLTPQQLEILNALAGFAAAFMDSPAL